MGQQPYIFVPRSCTKMLVVYSMSLADALCFTLKSSNVGIKTTIFSLVIKFETVISTRTLLNQYTFITAIGRKTPAQVKFLSKFTVIQYNFIVSLRPHVTLPEVIFTSIVAIAPKSPIHPRHLFLCAFYLQSQLFVAAFNLSDVVYMGI
jgi:hypothetical protein